MVDAPVSTFFNKGASQAASQIIDWVLAGMESFIPAKKCQLKPNSQPCFTPECATAIARRNHFSTPTNATGVMKIMLRLERLLTIAIESLR